MCALPMSCPLINLGWSRSATGCGVFCMRSMKAPAAAHNMPSAAEAEATPVAVGNAGMAFRTYDSWVLPNVNLVTDAWNTTSSGSWTVASDWTLGTPVAGDSVNITKAGNYTVTLTTNTGALAALTLGGAGGTQTLDVLGTLTLAAAGALNIYQGATLIADAGGLIASATIDPYASSSTKSASILYNGGTLSGITLWGTLNLSSGTANVTIANGITLDSNTGSAGGAINLTGADAVLDVAGVTTLNAVSITMGGAVAATLMATDVGGAGILTFGATDTLKLVAGTTLLGDAGGAGDGVVNDGTLSAALGNLTVFGNRFANAGVIAISGTDTILLDSANFTNSGSISVSTANSALTIGTAGSVWASTGTISQSGGSLTLNGNFSGASLGSVHHGGGVLNVNGLVQNTGGTIALGAGSALGTKVMVGGTIIGGTIQDAGGGFLAEGGTLSGVTYDGSLSLLSSHVPDLTIQGGITLAGVNGAGAGAIRVGANYAAATLTVIGSTTFNNATLTLGSGRYNSYLVSQEDAAHDAAVLTFGKTAVLSVIDSATTYLSDGGGMNDGIVNNGLITAIAPNGNFAIDAGFLTNAGTLVAGDGMSLDLQDRMSAANSGTMSAITGASLIIGYNESSASFTNTGLISAVGGANVAGSAYFSNVAIGYGAPAGTILNGGTIAVTNGGTVAIGTSQVADGVFINTGSMSAAGTLALGGYTQGASLILGYSSYGTIANSGHISVSSGGTLEIDGAATGGSFVNAGTITIARGALFQLGYSGGQEAALNTGTIVAAGANVYLDGNLETGFLAHFSNAGGTTTIGYGCEASNIGGTIKMGASAGQFVLGGTIIGGTINDTGGGLVGNTGTLQSVIYQGTLNQSADALLYVTDGIVLTGLTGTGGGTIDMSGYALGYFSGPSNLDSATINLSGYAQLNLAGGTALEHSVMTVSQGAGLYVYGNETINTATIDLGSTTGSAVAASFGEPFFNAGALTLGAGVSINFTGSYGYIEGGYGSTEIFTSAAIITDNMSGGTLHFTGSDFLNNGTILDGAGANLILQSVATLNDGIVELSGGTLSLLNVTNAGTISGFGTLVPNTLTNAGGITATGGLLKIAGGSVTGAGMLSASTGATLEIGGAASGGTLGFGGAGATIRLDQAGLVTDIIAGAVPTDMLDLAGVTATAQAVGGTLVVSVAGVGVLDYVLAPNDVGETVAASSDGAGGTDLAFYNLASASQAAPSSVSFGNLHVGGSAFATLTIGNNAPVSLYTEELDASIASFSAGVLASGSFSLLAAGQTDSKDLLVGLNTGVAGAVGGNAVISLFSDGTGVDGNGQTGIGTQSVAVTGAVYAYAAPALNTTTLNLGAARVGGSLAGSFVLSNGTSASVYQESLIYALTGLTPANGTLLAGGSAQIGVTLATGTSGNLSAGGTLALTSSGSIDGLGNTSLGSDSLTVTGEAFQTAVAQLSAAAINFGNVHVGAGGSASVTLTNSATGVLVDELVASVGAISTGFSSNASLVLASLASGGITVGFAAAPAGAYGGSLSLALVSHDSVLADLQLGTQTISLSGAAYAYAAPSLGSTSIDLGPVRTGGSLTGSFVLSNGGTYSAYQENLLYALSGLNSANGSATILSGGVADVGFSLGSAVSGTISTQGTFGLVSSGSIDGLGNTSLGNQIVTATEEVYQTAVAQVSSNSFNFGIVHVGDSVAAELGVGNTATGALVDELLASMVGSSGAFSANGSLALTSGQNGSIAIALSTGSAGVFAGSLAVSLVSHDGVLADLSLGNGTITLAGTVDNYAQAALGAASGSGSYSAGTLNFATAYFGGGSNETMSVTNSATGQADLLEGSLSLLGGSETGFTNAGLGGFSGLSAGQAFDGLDISVTATLSGSYSETIVLAATGYNASGYAGALVNETLSVSATVIGTYTLDTGADTISAGNGTDIITATGGTLNSGDNINGGGGSNTLVLAAPGSFDLALPATLLNIGSVDASEVWGGGIQNVTLRAGTTLTVNVASVAGGSISIVGAKNSDTINLGNGTDSVVVGAKTETINGGAGADSFAVNAATIYAGIHAGVGANALTVTGGGTLGMGPNLTGNFASVTLTAGTGAADAYKFTANAQQNLAIIANGGTDTIIVGAASQSVTGAGANTVVTVDATIAEAGLLVSNVGTGSVLAIGGTGTATLNASLTGLTVQLKQAATLTLSSMGFLTAIGEGASDTIMAAAGNQTLTSMAGHDSLTGYAGFGDEFLGTAAGLKADVIGLFGGNDVIDISNLAYAGLTETVRIGKGDAVLSLTGTGGSTSFTLMGSFDKSSFAFASDGHGGTNITCTGH